MLKFRVVVINHNLALSDAQNQFQGTLLNSHFIKTQTQLSSKIKSFYLLKKYLSSTFLSNHKTQRQHSST